MPKCGSQCYLCDVPIRFDTYNGCSHDCKYCFARTWRDISEIKLGEGPKDLKDFIEGKRTPETKWCDWNIPIHWGGLSDPFQPCEKIHRRSYECLKIFAETKYPFLVSTKGRIVAEDDYIELLSQCNVCVQISLVCKSYDKLEQGCPPFDERLEIVRKVSKHVPRVIIRIQPYMHEVFEEVYENLEKFRDAGAYGVIVEGMKFKKKKPGLVKVAGDICYPYDLIKSDFLQLRERAHELGLKIYAGENRLRRFGDSLTCCGVADMPGFEVNTFNLNHLVNGDLVHPKEQMRVQGTGEPFTALHTNTAMGRFCAENSFVQNMLYEYNRKPEYIKEVFGVNSKKPKVAN